MCVCVCVRERERDRQTDRQTDRQVGAERARVHVRARKIKGVIDRWVPYK